MKRRSLAILLSLFLLFGLTACGGSAKGTGSNSYASSQSAKPVPAPAAEADYGGYWSDAAEMPAEAEMESVKAGGTNGGDSRSNLPDGVKMIYRANLELETTEYDKAREDIAALTKQLGGYFEEQNSSNYTSGYRSASYTVRVPAERFETFLHQIGTLCSVRWQSQSADDVSEYYYGMESRLETAKLKLDRLQELLAQAENMEDIITIENAISDVEYQIESLSGELRHYDALIGYSTICVTLNEVYKVTEPEVVPLTFSQRIGRAFHEGVRDFADTMEDFAEWLAYSWLGILVFVLVLVVAVKLFKRIFRRDKGEKRERRILFRKKDNTPESPVETNEAPQQ